jgi:hypothetical protein
LGPQLPEQHCAWRTHPVPMLTQPHLPPIPHTLLQQSRLEVHWFPSVVQPVQWPPTHDDAGGPAQQTVGGLFVAHVST